MDFVAVFVEAEAEPEDDGGTGNTPVAVEPVLEDSPYQSLDDSLYEAVEEGLAEIVPVLVLESVLHVPYPSSVLAEGLTGRVPASVVPLLTSDVLSAGGRVAQGVLVLLVVETESVSELMPLVLSAEDEGTLDEPIGSVPTAVL